MKVRPYMIALTFGDGPEGRLYNMALLAPTHELACAHATSIIVQTHKIEQPLSRVLWQEVQEDFLVEALKGLRGEGGDTKVVSLRAVESEPGPVEVEPTAPTCEHDWVYSSFPGSGRSCMKCGEFRE